MCVTPPAIQSKITESAVARRVDVGLALARRCPRPDAGRQADRPDPHTFAAAPQAPRRERLQAALARV